MADFLAHLSDGNVLKINIIRSWMRTVLIGQFSEEVALCFEGVGGSGKSVFAKFLTRLFQLESGEQNPVAEMDLARLPGRFETAKMIGARLVIFSDVGLRRGLSCEHSSILKRLISHESIPMEWKNSKLAQVQVQAFYMFHSDYRWVDDDMLSDLAGRLLWFDVGKAARVPDPFLLDKLSQNTQGFFNWCLKTPKSIQRLSGSVEAINRESGSLREDLMTTWILETFFPKEDSEILLGANKNAPAGAFLSFTEFCEKNGAEPCTFSVFAARLIDAVRSLGVNITKKRRNTGMIIVGLSWMSPEAVPFPRGFNSIITALRSEDPFLGWIENNPALDVKAIVSEMREKDKR
jgi:phage/plasmid-associated DNA primase